MTDSKLSYNPTLINPIEKYTEVQRSKIHGFGLFAKKLIQKGTIWWYARPQDVLIMTKDQFQILETSHTSKLIDNFIQTVLTYSYYERELDALIFCLDNSRFVNHSINANSVTKKENGFCVIARRDIQPGEEISEDYSKYTPCAWLVKYKKWYNYSCW
jgi:SET domain-containing protein